MGFLDKYEMRINGEPLSKIVSDHINFGPVDIADPLWREQKGSISWTMDNSQLNNVFRELDKFNTLWEQKKVKVTELMDKVSEYMNKKVKDYCIKNNLLDPNLQVGFSKIENQYENKYEVRYLGDLVCGAKINAEIKDINTTEATISLELY